MPPLAEGSWSVLAVPTVKVRWDWLSEAAPKPGTASAATVIVNEGALVAVSESLSVAESVTEVAPLVLGVPLSVRVAALKTSPGTAGERA